MGIVANVTEQHEVPHESGQWMVFRKLPGRALREAREARESQQRKAANEMVDIVVALQEGRIDDEGVRGAVRALQYDLSQYDIDKLLQAGIVDWSYNEPVDRKSIAQLDSRTEEWAAQMVLDISRPPKEEAEKNS